MGIAGVLWLVGGSRRVVNDDVEREGRARPQTVIKEGEGWIRKSVQDVSHSVKYHSLLILYSLSIVKVKYAYTNQITRLNLKIISILHWLL